MIRRRTSRRNLELIVAIGLYSLADVQRKWPHHLRNKAVGRVLSLRGKVQMRHLIVETRKMMACEGFQLVSVRV